MKKFFIATSLALAAFAANANTTITLTPEQAAQLAKASTTDAKNISAVVREEASAWGEMGANMGKALVGAAKEVGVAANEFSQTPLGKVTVAVVVYKVIGEDLIGKIVGLGILVTMLGVAVWFLRTSKFSEVEYTYVPVMWGAFNIKRELKRKTSDDAMVARTLGALFSTLIGMLVGLMVMF